MAIPYVRVTFWHLLPHGGLCALGAYLIRGTVTDHRLKKRFDYRRLGCDLVHSELIAAPTIRSAAHFAQRLDAAEAKKVKNWSRRHWPQVCASLVIALPSARQTSLDEAIEITRMIAQRVVGRHSLPVLLIVHDPGILDPDAANRHAHVLIGLREVSPEGAFSPTKITELLGRVRAIKSKKLTFAEFVEGINFPDLSRDVQTRYFAEAGLDLVVDPISPRPGRHWSRADSIADPARVRRHLEEMCKQTRAAVLGDAVELLDQMQRRRASIPLAEIRHIVDRVIDGTRDRAAQLARIKEHPGVVRIGPPNVPAPHVTTRKVLRRLQRAAILTDQAITARRVYVARAPTGDSPNKELTRLCRKAMNDCQAPRSAIRVAVVGETQSHADWSLTGTTTESSTSEEFAPTAGRPTVVVLPRAESTSDLALAEVIVKALSTNARLVFGFAEDRADGIANRRFAAWIASRAYQRRHTLGAHDAVRLLRCGLVKPALGSLSRRGIVRFGIRRKRADADFIVINDQTAITSRRQARRSARAPDRVLSGILLPNGDRIEVGDHVLLGRTDYSKRPAVLREGAIVQVTRIDQIERHIEVQTQTGAKADVDLALYSELKRADFLSVREAQAIPQHSRLRIEMRTPAHAYACLLLAAKHRGAAVLFVSPRVARNLKQLIRVVEASLPGALPWERDPTMHKIFAPEFGNEEVTEAASPISHAGVPLDELFELEDPDTLQPLRMDDAMPPDPEAAEIPLPDQTPLPYVLDSETRGTIADHPSARNTFELIRDALADDAVDRQETLARLIERCGKESPLTRVVNVLTRSYQHKTRGELATLDLPTVLQELPTKKRLTLFEAYLLQIDLGWAGLRCSGCGLVPEPAHALIADENNLVGTFDAADDPDGNETEPLQPKF